MRTVFLGTSGFAAAVLERVAASDHRPQLVVTRPDRPAGRGRRLTAPPVARAARILGIEIDQPQSVNAPEALAAIAAAAPDVVCVCAFGALITEPLLSTYDMLNVHPSLLPRWRGAAPVERAIMAGDGETGVSIMRVTAGLDSGPVCLAAVEPVDNDDTYATLADRLQRMGGELLVQALDERPACVEQDDALATYADKIGPEDRLLAPTEKTAVELERVVRALEPHIGARLELGDGSYLGVSRAAALSTDGEPAPGELAAGDGRLVLGCRSGALDLLQVRPPGGRTMPAADYLRGRGLPG